MKALHTTFLIFSAALLPAGCTGDGGDGSGSGGGGGDRSAGSQAQSGTNREGKKNAGPDALAGVWTVIDVDFGGRRAPRQDSSDQDSSEQNDEKHRRSPPNLVQYVPPRNTPLLRARDRCWFSAGRLTVCRTRLPFRSSRTDGSGDDKDEAPPPFLKQVQAAEYTLNTKARPWQIDFVPLEEDDWLVRGICDVNQETLRLCTSRSENARPTRFETDRSEGSWLYVLERVAPLPPGYEDDDEAEQDDPLLVTSFSTLGVTLETDDAGRVRELAVSTFDGEGNAVDSADFGNKDLERLKRLKHLQRLDLRGSKLTKTGLMELAAWPRLEVLRLDSLPVTNETLAVIAQLDRLQGLSLRGTRVTGAGLEHLSDLTYLHVLDAPQTKQTRRGLAELRRELPHLVFFYRPEDFQSNGGGDRSEDAPRPNGKQSSDDQQPAGERGRGLLPTLPGSSPEALKSPRGYRP